MKVTVGYLSNNKPFWIPEEENPTLMQLLVRAGYIMKFEGLLRIERIRDLEGNIYFGDEKVRDIRTKGIEREYGFFLVQDCESCPDHRTPDDIKEERAYRKRTRKILEEVTK